MFWDITGCHRQVLNLWSLDSRSNREVASCDFALVTVVGARQHGERVFTAHLYLYRKRNGIAVAAKDTRRFEWTCMTPPTSRCRQATSDASPGTGALREPSGCLKGVYDVRDLFTRTALLLVRVKSLPHGSPATRPRAI